MSEFWSYHAIKTEDPAAVAAIEKRLKDAEVDALLHRENGWVFVTTPAKEVAERLAEVVVWYMDHEEAAWDFAVYKDGKKLGSGIFGENGETGADNQGFEGDLAATATALGVTPEALEETFQENSNPFTELLGMPWVPMSEVGMPEGVNWVHDLDD